MNQEKRQQMMAEAPIPGLIIRLAIPTIISMLITAFYNMADTFFVGKIGTSATAAVGIVFPLMAIIQAFGFLFGHGSGNSVSRKLGAGEKEDASHLASCGFFLALFFGICLLVFGTLFLDDSAKLLGATDTSLQYTKQYLRIILIGAPYMTASLVLNNLLRFQGCAFYSMIAITSGAVLNIILDPLLIFGFGMGVEGAALATIISQFIAFLLLILVTYKSGCLTMHISHVKYIPTVLIPILGGGLPSLCRQGLNSVATIALNHAAAPYGDAAIAAMSIVMRITFFASATVIGFGQGFQPVCGFNYGAGNKKRVFEAFWFCIKFATVVLGIISIIGFIFAPNLVALFRKDDLDVIVIGTKALRAQCIPLPFMAWVIINNMLFQTTGNTAPASILASARQGIFFLPAIIILPIFFGLTGVQFTPAVADSCSFILACCFYGRLHNKL